MLYKKLFLASRLPLSLCVRTSACACAFALANKRLSFPLLYFAFLFTFFTYFFSLVHHHILLAH